MYTHGLKSLEKKASVSKDVPYLENTNIDYE